MNDINKIICQNLQHTNDINGEYCNVYEYLFRQNIGDKVNYSGVKNQLNDLKSNLLLISNEARGFTNANDAEVNNVIQILIGYQDLLNKRISFLSSVTDKLHNKAECTGPKYSFFAYKSDVKQLEKMEKENNGLGSSLQTTAVPFMRKYRDYI